MESCWCGGMALRASGRERVARTMCGRGKVTVMFWTGGGEAVNSGGNEVGIIVHLSCTVFGVLLRMRLVDEIGG